MNEERINLVERELETVKSVTQPLIEKMSENTAAVTLLTHRVGDLVDNMKESKEAHDNLEKRVTTLETDKAIRDSSIGWKTKFRDAAIGALVTSSLGVLYFLFVDYSKSQM